MKQFITAEEQMFRCSDCKHNEFTPMQVHQTMRCPECQHFMDVGMWNSMTSHVHFWVCHNSECIVIDMEGNGKLHYRKSYPLTKWMVM